MAALALVPQNPEAPPPTPASTPEETLSVSDTAAILGLLQEVNGKIDDMRGELAGVDKAQAVLVAWKVQRENVHDPDIERRMRVLEADRYRIWGIGLALSAIAGYAAKYFGH